MSSTERRLARAFELMRTQLEREASEGVAPFQSPAELLDRLCLKPPREGVSDEELFETLEAVVAATPRTTTKRFFNQLFGGRDDFGTIGELLASLLNSSMYTFKAAGPQVVIEREITNHMARKVGYAEGEGTLVPGGSQANLAGMLLARNSKCPESRNGGVDGPRLTFYASANCHYSVPKSAGILGIGRDQMRKIAADDRGRMRPDLLREAIEKDLSAGHRPFLVMATAGTTVQGAYDPLVPLADLCDEFDLWFHIDGALGGSAAMSSTHAHLLAGSERSDSFTWDAHKLMGVPLSCSVILTRERGPLHDSLNESASYLFHSDEEEYDLGTISLQCGRRNDALKLWAAWQHHGDLGFEKRIDTIFRLTRYAADKVIADPALRLACEPESITLCFEVVGKSTADICEKLWQQGRAVVGHSEVLGRRVIRLAVVNGDLEESDLDRFFDEVREVAKCAEDGDNALPIEG